MSTTLTRPETKIQKKPVLFELYAPDASSVYLAGDFNGWADHSIEMRRGKDGNWLVTLLLAPGFYEYKFIVDGIWTCADEADHTCMGKVHCTNNDYGSCNRLIHISANRD